MATGGIDDPGGGEDQEMGNNVCFCSDYSLLRFSDYLLMLTPSSRSHENQMRHRLLNLQSSLMRMEYPFRQGSSREDMPESAHDKKLLLKLKLVEQCIDSNFTFNIIVPYVNANPYDSFVINLRMLVEEFVELGRLAHKVVTIRLSGADWLLSNCTSIEYTFIDYKNFNHVSKRFKIQRPGQNFQEALRTGAGFSVLHGDQSLLTSPDGVMLGCLYLQPSCTHSRHGFLCHDESSRDTANADSPHMHRSLNNTGSFVRDTANADSLFMNRNFNNYGLFVRDTANGDSLLMNRNFNNSGLFVRETANADSLLMNRNFNNSGLFVRETANADSLLMNRNFNNSGLFVRDTANVDSLLMNRNFNNSGLFVRETANADSLFMNRNFNNSGLFVRETANTDSLFMNRNLNNSGLFVRETANADSLFMNRNFNNSGLFVKKTANADSLFMNRNLNNSGLFVRETANADSLFMNRNLNNSGLFVRGTANVDSLFMNRNFNNSGVFVRDTANADSLFMNRNFNNSGLFVRDTANADSLFMNRNFNNSGLFVRDTANADSLFMNRNFNNSGLFVRDTANVDYLHMNSSLNNTGLFARETTNAHSLYTTRSLNYHDRFSIEANNTYCFSHSEGSNDSRDAQNVNALSSNDSLDCFGDVSRNASKANSLPSYECFNRFSTFSVNSISNYDNPKDCHSNFKAPNVQSTATSNVVEIRACQPTDRDSGQLLTSVAGNKPVKQSSYNEQNAGIQECCEIDSSQVQPTDSTSGQLVDGNEQINMINNYRQVLQPVNRGSRPSSGQGGNVLLLTLSHDEIAHCIDQHSGCLDVLLKVEI